MEPERTMCAPASRHDLSILAIATIGYLISAWAWALLAPLAPLLRGLLELTAIQQAMVVSLPVVVGALGRVPIGALTDKLGWRATFLLVTAVTIGALLVLATVVDRSVSGLLFGAALLGVAGTNFAVGVPYVSAGFAAGHRGLALGVLGAGLVGGAVGGLTTVRLVEAYGIAAPFVAPVLAQCLFAVLVVVKVRDAPRAPSRVPRADSTLAAALRLPITRRATLWNAVNSALYVTFSSFLPVYLTTVYDLSLSQTGYAMAGSVILVVLTRPVGGWLSDRFSPRTPLVAALAVLACTTGFQAFTPPLPLAATVVLPALTVALGIASGAVLAEVAAVTPPEIIGRVGGVVTGVAGLAGFAAPLLMAYSISRYGGYTPALCLLAAAAALAARTALTGTRQP